MSNESIGREAAERFRAKHMLGVAPIANMARLIERTMGIGVAYVQSSVPGHGMTMFLDGKYLMAVGCTKHPMRLRSTLAHELGRLQIGTIDRGVNAVNWSDRRPEEIQADAFARHLLMPLTAVIEMVNGKEVTLSTLSDLVQTYLASPSIVTIQMRDAGVIDADTYEEWKTLATGNMAARFGWHSDYVALVEQSSKPRGPQNLMVRVMEGYRQGSVSSSTVAKLSGDACAADVKAALAEDGISPVVEETAVRARAPKDTGERLTPEELAALMGGTE